MVKDKSWGLTVLLLLVFVLVLFIAQVFVPFEVIHAQSEGNETVLDLSLIHISEPTRPY